ncbi:MAG TPA: hypothetical protein VHO94_03900, partial [Oscillospiraceae bacterium]|nr:hypothetical protein [Oscillospiraceae bacterium]
RNAFSRSNIVCIIKTMLVSTNKRKGDSPMQSQSEAVNLDLKLVSQSQSLGTMAAYKSYSLPRKHKTFQLIQYLGPAFVVSVAYIDPANNILIHII